MKKIFTLFVLAICACLNAAAQFAPEDGKQYVIKDASSAYYIVLAVGNDSQASDTDNTTHASLGVSGTPFTFTPTDGGFILSTDEGKYLGNSRSRTWNVNVDVDDTVWYIYDYEATSGRCRIYKNASQGLGLDNHTIGSGIYTDKSYQYWQIEEYVAPEEVHTVVATVDGVEYTMLEDGEGGYIVTIPEVESGEHSVTVSYDGEETTETFTTSDYKVFDATVSVGKVTVHYKDGVITITGDGINNDPNPTPETKELYVLGFDGNWDPSSASLTVEPSEDGTYQFGFTNSEKAWFCLSTALGEDSNDWSTFNASRLGAPEQDYALYYGEKTELQQGWDTSFAVNPGTWVFRVNVEALTIEVLAGADRPEPDAIHNLTTEAPAAIYDLQGRRVRNAEKGVYIVNGVRVIK